MKSPSGIKNVTPKQWAAEFVLLSLSAQIEVAYEDEYFPNKKTKNADEIERHLRDYMRRVHIMVEKALP